MNVKTFLTVFFLSVISINSIAQKKEKKPLPLAVENGKLTYNADSLGNRIIDFSYCGYKASNEPIPNVPIVVVVPVINGDATNLIQQAINYVATLPLDTNGFRGAVLLQKGKYEVLGQLRINASGVVLRGSGMKEEGTTIVGAGTGRLALIKIIGINNISKDLYGLKITDAYVPVNATRFNVDSSILIKQHSNKIIIRRPSTAKWIDVLGTQSFGGGLSALGWKPNDQDIYFDRTITKIEGTTITIDAPITTALDSTYGGATMYFYNNDKRVINCGIENLRCISVYDKDNIKDEDHRWNAINIENAEDCWVRQTSFENFAGSAVSVLETSKKITIEDCIATNPISEIGGQRRYTFLTTGQQTLFQRCYSENGYHDFSVGFCAPGPNAFVQCQSNNSYNFSGAIDSWASGILFDLVNIDGNALRFGNRGQDANGAGWSAANSVFWNCTAAKIDCYKPPTAQNYSFGSWAQFNGDGFWAETNNTINPNSLYYQQLKERLGKEVSKQAQLMPLSTEASSSPTIEVAQALTKEAAMPRPQLRNWIETATNRNPIWIKYEITKVKIINKNDENKNKQPSQLTSLGGLLGYGSRTNVQWWGGGLTEKNIRESKMHITRFVPGRTGKGLTDDLNEITDEMVAKKIIALDHNYGLWYDRRRDDHQRVRRMDGEVWAPFYELPFARSGKDTAWDGLSKYDLTKYNQFYWSRLKQFADLADAKGLVLLHQNYFQHNIIEAGAHYADFPWRTANNINNTGFNEPVNYAGDKRIFYAEQFYDLSNTVRKDLHKKYIRQCLNNFKDNKNVIQFIGEEFTGPTHFVKFWLDVIIEWKKETGQKPLIALSVTKDVQDSILHIKKYVDIIDVIDIKYWHYQADSTLYAPKGGQSLAPRQHARLLKPKKTSFEQVYRAVKEYKDKFPTKAILYSGDSYPEFGIAAFMAGASMCNLPKDFDEAIVKAAVNMKPVVSGNKNEYLLSDGKKTIVYNIEIKKLIIK